MATSASAIDGMVAFLLLVYAGNAFGPTPSIDTPPAGIAGPALAMWLLVAWAYWVDRNRKPATPG